ncbi:MAG: methyl-accepting chemotaxis protein [Myxococcota bacterium]
MGERPEERASASRDDDEVTTRRHDLGVREAMTVVACQTVALAAAWGGATYAQRYQRDNERTLTDRVTDMARVVADAERVATGDLRAEEHTSGVMRSMLVGLRRVLRQGLDNGRAVARSAQAVEARSRRQVEVAETQMTAVEETRRVAERLGQATATITSSAESVLEDARATVATHRQVRALVTRLAAREQRISEVLDIIKTVARKADLIALNAALEGVRAGEAGRGFRLVARELQTLSGTTTENAGRVKDIVGEIRQATEETVVTIEQATQRATSTMRSAQRIATMAEAQAEGAARVTAAMREIEGFTRGFTEGSRETLAAMHRLTEDSETLAEAVEAFRL